MNEHIYTIPVNEAFDEATDMCPFCLMESKLEETELQLIMGASMMEPDIRKETNKKGFCQYHFSKMLTRGNRLPMALMMQSHIDEIRGDVKSGGFLAKDPYAKTTKRIDNLNQSCYVCDRIENNFSKMLETTAVLYAREQEFRKKFDSSTVFCLPHYKRILEAAKNISKPFSADLSKNAERIMTDYLNSLYDDVSLFCKKFDYRFNDLPWGNAKNSIERTVSMLTGKKL